MSDNRSYLKNLSQKKYAWMESAAIEPSPSSTSPPLRSDDTATATTTTTAATTSKRTSDSKKGQASSPPKPRKKQRQKEPAPLSTSSSPASGVSTPTIIKPTKLDKQQHVEQAEDDTDDIDDGDDNTHHSSETTSLKHITTTASSESRSHQPTVRLDQPNFKYTTFPLKGYTILPTRNIASNFVRSDTSYVRGHKAGDAAICPKEEEEWHDTIIIHPGSRNLRIGLASEAYPITVPHVLARRVRTPGNKKAHPHTKDDDALREMRNELSWRMKNAKRRTLPNADNQVISFNSHAPKEIIPDHNDPYRVEWIDFKEQQDEVYVADSALKVPFGGNDDVPYDLFYPWRNGTLNQVDYTSLYAVLGDLQTIWTSVIQSELEIEDHSLENFNAVLVVPDAMDRSYISALITMMLQHMKFRGVIVQQASSCATFGAGVSSACVVDIGAQTTSIACIDEGVQLVDSRVTINIGGDDITRTFASFLTDNSFPYHALDLSRPYDWRLVEELKEKWCTMNEAEISVQVYDFFVRAPHQHTYKYQCKVYDEVFLAPLCLVYPNILKGRYGVEEDEVAKNNDGLTSSGVIDDIGADELSTVIANPSSQATVAARFKQPSSQSATPKPDGSPAPSNDLSTAAIPTKNNSNIVYNYYPIDVAIAQSIQSASGNSDDRLKRYFTNIIVVGGGVAKISNFDRVLEDRLLSTMIARSSGIEDVDVLPAPRELDPEILVWKGASVLCKLEIAKDMWIGEPEWVESGLRLIRDRSLLLF